jgi:UDP-glucose 4-epimerase
MKRTPGNVKRSILIGSNGYLGRHLSYFLEREGFNNQNYDKHPEAAQGVTMYSPLDITRREGFGALDSQVNFIFMFAGITGTADGFDKYEEFISVNEIGLLNLLTWMRETGCKARIVFPSTRLVYKGRKNYALKEDDPKETKTIYAVNKISAENILISYQNAFGIDFTIFRICVPFGNLFDDAYSYGTLGFFLEKAIKGSDITIYGDGSIRRTFTHVEDISRLILKAVQIDETKNDVFNIGGENLSLLEAASLVAEKYGVNVTFQGWPEMALRLESDDTVFDDFRLNSIVSYLNRYNVKQWLANQG